VPFSLGGAKDVVAALFERAHEGMYWLDVLGLNTDNDSADGDHVLRAIWLKSDMRFGQLSASLLSDRYE
jgi:hypothetical protein